MNPLFLKDLAEKTHRELRGRIEDGWARRSESRPNAARKVDHLRV